MIAVFLVATVVLALVFHSLSAPRNVLAPGIRLALGMLAVYIALLAMLWTSCSSWAVVGTVAAAALASTVIQEQGLALLTQAFGRLRLLIYFSSVATLAALIFLFVPIATFLTAPGALSIHLDRLISVNARDAIALLYISAAFYMLAVTPRMRTLLTLLAFSALALGLIYALVVPFGYPMMTGLAFEQLPMPVQSTALRALVDVALVMAVAPAACAALIKFGARPIVVAIVLVDVMIGTVAAIKVSQDRVGGTGGPEDATQLSEQPLRFSPTHPNVLILFLDRFMGSYVESILQTDPILVDRLSGFTWYPRTVAAGQNSIAGKHPLLGGYDYLPIEMNARGKPLRDLSAEAFSILPYNFSRQGYQVNMINPRGLGFTMAGDCRFLQIDGVTCTHIPLSVARRRAERMGFSLDELAETNFADLLVLLGSMRTAPYTVKEILLQKGPWRPFLHDLAATTFKEWAHLQAYPEMSQTDAQEPNLNFIINLLPHEPYYIGEDCLPHKERFTVPPEEVQRRGHLSLYSLQHAITARCTLIAVADYLDFLKSAGVYDNTKIVIVSDHGVMGRVDDRSTRAVAGGTQADPYTRSRSVLMVKEIRAEGPLRVSEQFLPNAEVPRIVCEEIGGCVNPYLGNKPIVAAGRDDPFYVSFVPWQFSRQKPEAFVIEKQWVLKGKDPYAASGWTNTE